MAYITVCVVYVGNSEATKLLLDAWISHRDQLLDRHKADLLLDELEDYNGNTLMSWLILNGEVPLFVSIHVV
jgi:hypothetical protein